MGKIEDSYWKLIYKLSLLLAELDLKVLSTNISMISNVKNSLKDGGSILIHEAQIVFKIIFFCLQF